MLAEWTWREPSLPAPDTKNPYTQPIIALLAPNPPPPLGFYSGIMLQWFNIHLHLMDPSFIYYITVIHFFFPSFIYLFLYFLNCIQSQPLQKETLDGHCPMTKPIMKQVKKSSWRKRDEFIF